MALPPIPNEPIGESHLWRDWLFKLRASVNNPFVTVQHNLLGGLQGGLPNDYQHLTTSQVNQISQISSIYNQSQSNLVLTWLSL